VPTLVKGISDVKAVASGQGFTLALKMNGTVWAWGSKYLPVEVKGLSNVISIAADWANGYAVKNDGTVWLWGGILPPNIPLQIKAFKDITAISLGWGNKVALKKDGTVWIPLSGQIVQVDGLTDIIEVAAGAQYSYGLKKDGTVWYWGSSSENGTVVNGAETSDQSKPKFLEGIKDVMSVKASAGGPLLLKRDGTVWTQGDNLGGQLGIGSYEDSDIPVQVKGLTKIKEINASGTAFTSMALKVDNTLWSWGNGYVGDGTKWYRNVPVMIKSYDSEILQDVNTIKVDLNGNELVFDQLPIIINNRTMVPLRKIFESLGATIKWDQITSTLTAERGQTVVKLTIGSKVAYVNDKEVSLDVSAIIVNGRTLVPIKFIGTSFGADVIWDDITKSVIIKIDELKPMSN
jgi:hypothetical protein